MVSFKAGSFLRTPVQAAKTEPMNTPTPLPLCWCSESRVGRSTEGSIDVDLAERKQGPESQSIETKNGLDGI